MPEHETSKQILEACIVLHEARQFVTSMRMESLSDLVRDKHVIENAVGGRKDSNLNLRSPLDLVP
eukprot:8996086-Karenia_brevis.AAC.1